MDQTSPDSCVEKRTISEQEAMDRPLPGNLPGEGEVILFRDGKEKFTLSPTLILLPLHVESPASSEVPTSHQCPSISCSDDSGGVTRLSAITLAVEEMGLWVSLRITGGLGFLFGGEEEMRKWGVSKMMLIAAAASLLAIWRARMMSISEKSWPTTARTTETCSSVALLPIGVASDRQTNKRTNKKKEKRPIARRSDTDRRTRTSMAFHEMWGAILPALEQQDSIQLRFSFWARPKKTPNHSYLHGHQPNINVIY